MAVEIRWTKGAHQLRQLLGEIDNIEKIIPAKETDNIKALKTIETRKDYNFMRDGFMPH